MKNIDAKFILGLTISKQKFTHTYTIIELNEINIPFDADHKKQFYYQKQNHILFYII